MPLLLVSGVKGKIDKHFKEQQMFGPTGQTFRKQKAYSYDDLHLLSHMALKSVGGFGPWVTWENNHKFTIAVQFTDSPRCCG